jgi:hypothetical protein
MSSVLYQIDGRDAKLRILIRYIGLSSSVLTSCISTVALVCEVLLNPALALLVFSNENKERLLIGFLLGSNYGV